MQMSYIAVVLNQASQLNLQKLALPGNKDVSKWECKCHHMTICMGLKEEYRHLIGKQTGLTGDAVAVNQLVVAVRINYAHIIGTKADDVPSDNPTKHITMYVNREGGGKPVDSNKFTDREWMPLLADALLTGTIELCN